MRKYHFKLQVLQKHRTMVEQDKRVTLSKTLTRLRSIESRLLEIDQDEVKARRTYASLGEKFGSEALSSSQFWVVDKFIQGQKVRRVEVKKELEKQENIARDHYTQYVKARQSLKIIDTLKDKDFARYKKNLLKYEMKQLDDVYTMRDRLSVRHKNQSGEDNEE